MKKVNQPNNKPIAVEGSSETGLPVDNSSAIGSSVSHRRVLFLAVSVVAIAIVAAVVVFLENRSSEARVGSESLNFAEVVITDLVQEETFDGTLGSIDDDPVRTQLGGTITEIAAPGDTVLQGDPLFSIDGEPVVLLYGDLPAFRDIAIGEASVTVSSHLFGTITSVAEPGTVVRQGDVLFSVDGQPVIVLYGEHPAYRDIAIVEEPTTVSSHLQGTITSVAESGTVIQQGDVLFSVNGQPVVALYGERPAYRDIAIVEEPTTVLSHLQGTITSVAEPGTVVRQGDVLYSVDGQPVIVLYGEHPAYRDIAIVEEPTTVSSHLQGTITSVAEPGTVVRQGDVLFSVNGQPVIVLYGEHPAYRDIAIVEEPTTVSSHLQGTITSVAESGTVIQQGDVLFSVNGQPVVALYGEHPAYRDIAIVEEPTIISSHLQGTITSVAEPGTVVRQGDVLFSVDGQPVVVLYGEHPAYRDIAIVEEPTTVSSHLQGTITSVAEPGTVIRQGDVLYSVNHQPVVVLYGEQPAYRNLYDTAPDLTAALEVVSFAERDLEAATMTLDEVLTADALSELESAVEEAEEEYREKLRRWFGPTVSEEYRSVSPGEILTSWGVTYAEIFDAESSEKDNPQTPWDELTIFAWVRFSPFAIDTSENPEPSTVNRFSPQWELEDAWSALENARDVRDAQGALDTAAVLAAEKAVSNAEDDLTAATNALAQVQDSTGPDVFQLEEALLTLGYDAEGSLVADGTFTFETTQAVLAFQAVSGLEQDGVIDFGEVVFLPGPTQVLALLASPGDLAGGGVVSVAMGDPTTGADVLQLEKALVTLGYDAGGALVTDGIFTPETTQAVLAFQAAIGLEQDGVIDHGEVVFLPEPTQVLAHLASPGDQAGGGVLSVAMGDPTTGPDVLQLEQSLFTLGYDAGGALVADGTFTPETTQAVLAFQAAIGLEQDGVIDHGEVVFLPGPTQVLAHLASLGDQAGGGVLSVATGDTTAGPDVLQLEQALVTLGFDADGSIVVDGIFTPETTQAVLAFQAAIGLEQDGIVDHGEIIFMSGPTQVLTALASPGDQAGGSVVSVATSDPTTGPDVLQLEQALVTLGYDAGGALVADGTFSPETTQAVLAFQAAIGLEQDGVIDHGEVVFLPGPAQVLHVLASPGDQAGGGGGVISVATGDPTTGPDVLQLEEALVTLGYDADGALVADGVFTQETTQSVLAFQEAVGLEQDGVIDHGEVVFLPGPAQVLHVLASPGDQAGGGGGGVISVATGDPTTGPDVLQLEEALVTLGYDANGALVADGVYTPETTEAVLAFQVTAGFKQDGIVNQGEVVFLPGAVRVTDQLATSGSGVGPGSAVLGISLSPKVVRVDLPANKQGSLAAGNAVTVELPDFTEVPATVLSVSKTATLAQYGPATFDVVIELDDPAPAAGLDEAPVDVIAVSDSVEDVMAVPVSALVALLEGGFAVEIDAGGGLTRLVAVEVEFFGESGMIEITSAVLKPGDRVVVP